MMTIKISAPACLVVLALLTGFKPGHSEQQRTPEIARITLDDARKAMDASEAQASRAR
jgi:hypothetical protein